MKINSLKYKDNWQEWELNNIDFFDLTLLVGVSGVGKTQILDAIYNLKTVASGGSLNGVAWEISFINNKVNYHWSGEFEYSEHRNINGSFINSKIISEAILNDEGVIAKRNSEEITFDDNIMPKLSPEESILNIFKAEDKMKDAYEGFEKIIFRNYDVDEDTFKMKNWNNNLDLKYTTLNEIRNNNLDIISKLYCLFENQKVAFNEIVTRFIDVFPQIEKIMFGAYEFDHRVMGDLPLLYFKEKNVDKWIVYERISSGMLITFLHLSELFLMKDGTVLLIDEIENSLGVNCLNSVIEDLLFEKSRLQVIATSHHPYIINNVPYDYWKIVTRNGGKITAYNAKDFDLEKSNHEKFMSLINLPQYKSGMQHI